MTLFYGYKRLGRVDDWKGLAGEDKWVATRSAYELAHCWHECKGLPEPIQNVFASAGHEVLRGLSVDLCLVEKPVFLDTRMGPSMTDLMAYGRNSSGDAIVVAVEGKADEPFASRVSTWVRGDGKDVTPDSPIRPTRARRLEFLSKHLATNVLPDSTLRYQLLHRTVSAVLEAQLHGAAAAVVLVHAFGPEAPENISDFSDFLRFLGGQAVVNRQVSGPFRLGEQRELPTFFLWWQQAVSSQAAEPSAAADAPQASRRSSTRDGGAMNRVRGEAFTGKGHGTLRYQLFMRAKRQIESSMAAGHYCEVIALCESVIADRLESRLSFLTQHNVGFQTLGRLLPDLKQVETDEAISSLLEELDQWRTQRNRALHELVKVEDGIPHTSWEDRIERLGQDAQWGYDLLKKLYHRVADLNLLHSDRVF